MVQLMPLLLTVSCSSKIQIGFTFLVPAYLGSPGKEAVKWLCVVLNEFVAIYQRVCQRKNFENWLTFGEVMSNSFFTHGVV